ncbi:MAG: RNA methyltransferase [Acidobacteriota bacterium]
MLLKNFSTKNIFIILSRPCNPENIGLAARGMKNTGFRNLRLIQNSPLSDHAFRTAVHSEEILKNAAIYSDLFEAVKDLNLVFAAAARHRKDFTSINFDEAVKKIISFSPQAKIGLLFGNERTGLVSKELRHSNFRFSIPQKKVQPSYNLASAVLLTLFQIYIQESHQKEQRKGSPLIARKEQEECIQLIIKKLEDKKFIHNSNRTHIIDMMYDLFGRLEMRPKDKRLLLAVFSKGVEGREKS